MSLTYAPKSAIEREVHCRCDKCGNLCDGIFQRLSGVDDWSPEPQKTLDILGWIPDGDRWFCSKFCRDVYAHAMTRESPIKPVVKLAAPLGPAQRAYAKP